MSVSKGYHIIPPGENRCIWMTAGVLQYQLCDRAFKCEECPLDLAMRHQVRSPAASADVSKTQLSAAHGTALREGFRYSRNHCWVLSVAPQSFRVGIEPGFSRVIGIPRAVVLPLKGQAVDSGRACAWIVTTGGTLPLEAPFGGSAMTTNTLLTESPHLLHQHPFDEGWLYEVAASEHTLQQSDLVAPDRIAGTYAADETRFLHALSAMLRGNQPDGGFASVDVEQRLESIVDVVGPAKYFDAVKQIYT